jgi:hypothetical protein
MIIGAPKSIDEFPVFADQEINELINGMENLVKSGVPGAVPAGIPIVQLARIASTIKAYHELAKKMAAPFAGIETPGTGQMLEAIDALQEEARALVEIDPPKEQVILQPNQSAKSRIITP